MNRALAFAWAADHLSSSGALFSSKFNPLVVCRALGLRTLLHDDDDADKQRNTDDTSDANAGNERYARTLSAAAARGGDHGEPRSRGLEWTRRALVEAACRRVDFGGLAGATNPRIDRGAQRPAFAIR